VLRALLRLCDRGATAGAAATIAEMKPMMVKSADTLEGNRRMPALAGAR
jgi:hypothetical protein